LIGVNNNMTKKFTIEKYEEIKKLLTDNKVSSSDLDKYILVKQVRYDRYRELNTYTDDEIIQLANNGDIIVLENSQK
jgi:trehalose-6-phosphate synthase